jgi:hypothetical protein
LPEVAGPFADVPYGTYSRGETMALKDWFRSQKVASGPSAESANDSPEEATPDSAPLPTAGEAAVMAPQSAASDSAPPETPDQQRSEDLGVPVKAAYSLVTATIWNFSMATEDGKTMVAQLHPAAAQFLSQSDPVFRQVYDRVQKDQTLTITGAGMAASPADAGQAFHEWLENKGVVVDLRSVAHKQFFAYTGHAQDPRDGSSFEWTVLFYFDLSS